MTHTLIIIAISFVAGIVATLITGIALLVWTNKEQDPETTYTNEWDA
jgi:ABC-type methionine transport system permease subunit